MKADYKYCNSLTAYSRFKTRVVHIGNIPMGGHNPVRIQSMTNTNTLDTIATVEQCIRLAEAGCEYVRITMPGIKEAENLEKIKKELHKRNFDIPLIADVHFNPLVAEYAAKIVEKVRINPGNYTDKKNFKKFEYTDSEYEEGIEKIRDRISPLIKICKEYGTAIRIGTNHGSLSDRIVSRYGDTPMGMVESALEFIHICEELNFGNIVLSMKASNVRVMIAAYRLLVHRMFIEEMDYPLHVGITEAGSGEEGRIKSAAGIGALLEDGIGDTIRVSLTEDPEAEIPVAEILAGRYTNRHYDGHIENIEESPINPFECHKRFSNETLNIGKDNKPVIIISSDYTIEKTASDYIFGRELQVNYPSIVDAAQWNKSDENSYPLFDAQHYLSSGKKSLLANFIRIAKSDITDKLIRKIKDDATAVLVLESDNPHAAAELRSMVFSLILFHCKCPVIIKRNYCDISVEEFQLFAATDIELLFADGLADGIWLEAESVNREIIEKASFDILQATGARIYKTEYISCPTCGRTSYNVFETIERIKRFTAHLKGLKIAVMGCVVNGPGEMADADYGYVGAGIGKINLYKGKTLVKRSIDEKDALPELIALLKENGDWAEES
ncbi:MAG: (E)-4-hydroxy-3-methylbut-2-enyl-diphosphate synthase [Bacteroidales bacterium]